MSAPPPPSPSGVGPPSAASVPSSGGHDRSAWRRLGRLLRTHPTPHARANIAIWSVCGLIWLVIIASVAAGQPPKGTAAAKATALTTTTALQDLEIVVQVQRLLAAHGDPLM